MHFFIGYGDETKGYCLYTSISKKLIISRNVVFEENQFWDWTENARLMWNMKV